VQETAPATTIIKQAVVEGAAFLLEKDTKELKPDAVNDKHIVH
jgi:hypothetical protein